MILCLSVHSLPLFLYPSFPHSLSLSLSSPGVMIKVAGMSLCSAAVITEERRVREEEGGREDTEKGVEQLEGMIQAAPHCPHLVWRYIMLLLHQCLNSVTSPKCMEYKSLP